MRSYILLLFVFIALFVGVVLYVVGVPLLLVLAVVGMVVLAAFFYLRLHPLEGKKKVKSTKEPGSVSAKTLPEMILVTDTELRVLSLSESVVRVLHKGRSELLNRGLFEILYLKHSGGALMDANLLGLEALVREKHVVSFDNLLLVASDFPVQKVKMTVTPVFDVGGEVEQLSFVVTGEGVHAKGQKSQAVVEQANVRQEALLEDLKRKLVKRGLMGLWTQLLLVEKATEDIALSQKIVDRGIEPEKEVVDISRLCSRIVALEQGYVRAFGSQLIFSLVNLGWRVSESFERSLQGNEEKSTDPFFTVKCNVKYVSVLVEKLIDLSVLLSTHAAHPKIQFIVGAERADLVVVWLRVSCPEVENEQLSQLFMQGYGEMRSWKNFQFGSGLEGHIANTVAEQLGMRLDVAYKSDAQECIFTLQVPRDIQVQSSVGVLKK